MPQTDLDLLTEQLLQRQQGRGGISPQRQALSNVLTTIGTGLATGTPQMPQIQASPTDDLASSLLKAQLLQPLELEKARAQGEVDVGLQLKGMQAKEEFKREQARQIAEEKRRKFGIRDSVTPSPVPQPSPITAPPIQRPTPQQQEDAQPFGPKPFTVPKSTQIQGALAPKQEGIFTGGQAQATAPGQLAPSIEQPQVGQPPLAQPQIGQIQPGQAQPGQIQRPQAPTKTGQAPPQFTQVTKMKTDEFGNTFPEMETVKNPEYDSWLKGVEAVALDEIKGKSSDVSGRIALTKEALKNVEEVKKLLFPTGRKDSFDRGLAAAAFPPALSPLGRLTPEVLPDLPGIPPEFSSKAQRLHSLLSTALRGRVLIQTGVTVRPEEERAAVTNFGVGLFSSGEAAENNFNRLQDFYADYLTGVLGRNSKIMKDQETGSLAVVYNDGTFEEL
jgi:hypothetical protein